MSTVVERLEKFETIRKMRDVLKNRDQSENTYMNYCKAVETFLKVRSDFRDPDEIVSKLKSGEVKVVDLFKDFIACFAPKDWNGKWKIKKTSLRLHVAGLKKFLRANNIRVVTEDIRDLMPRIPKERKHDIPTKQQLIEMLNWLSLRGKVMLTLMCGSGLRIGTVIKLQIRDIDLTQNPPQLNIPYSVVEKDEVIKKMKGAGSDDSRIHIVWMTPEAKEFLESYIAYRKRCGEVIKPESPVVTFQAWTLPSGGIRREKAGRFLNYWSAWREIRYALVRCGFADKGRAKLHPHIFRSFFRTMLAQAGIANSDIEYLLSHLGFYLESSYHQPELDYLKKQYISALPFLQIQSSAIEKTVLEKQARQIEELRHQVLTLRDVSEEQRKTIETLEKELRDVLGLKEDQTLLEKLRRLDELIQT